jgi:hypothetical protein
MPFLPKIKQIKNAKPPGNLIDPLTGLRFTGKFVQDLLGNFFKGDNITADSKPLQLVPFDNQADAEKYGSDFINIPVKPSEKDYEKGLFDRFFAKDGRTGRIIELDKPTYSKFKSEGKLYRKILRIQWYVTGEPEDQIINGYLYPGTKAKNQDVINQAEKILPGIGEQILKDPSQFVRK